MGSRISPSIWSFYDPDVPYRRSGKVRSVFIRSKTRDRSSVDESGPADSRDHHLDTGRTDVWIKDILYVMLWHNMA